MAPLSLSNLGLLALAQNASERLAGARVKKIQELDPVGYKIRLVVNKRDADLILLPDRFFLASETWPAKKQTTGFGAKLNKQLAGQTLARVQILGSDRIVRFSFETHALVAELFSRGNVLLLDANETIVALAHKEEWKGRTLARQEAYKPPQTNALSPDTLRSADLSARLSQSEKNLVPALVEIVNTAGAIAEHATLESGLEPAALAREIPSVQIEQLARAFNRLYARDRACDWGIVVRARQTLLVPVRLNLTDFAPLSTDVHAFLEQNARENQSLQAPAVSPEKTKSERPLAHAIQKQQAALDGMREKARRARRMAQCILENKNDLAAYARAIQKDPQSARAPEGFMFASFDPKKKILKLEFDE